MFRWQELPQPIFGLAPMDGVTDHVFRTIVYRHGPPDVMFTEFVSVEGLSRRIPALFNDLKYQSHERPMIAQIYGYEPEAFKASVRIVAEHGFDGVDINMGCPAKSVVHSGGGAALIRECPHAKTIIKTCGQTLKEIYEETGKLLPLSVKTRLGYEKNMVKDWIAQLLECEELSNISLHGRTLKQGYSGEADWDAIAQAAELAKGSGKTILGNGDIKNLADAAERIQKYKVNGVLLGRASYGNPWLFREKEKFRQIFPSSSLRAPSPSRGEGYKDAPPLPFEGEGRDEGVRVLLEHARLLWESKDPRQFIQIRKHCGWYIKGFNGAAELRAKLVRVSTFPELEEILHNFVIPALSQDLTGIQEMPDQSPA